jgi:hypothetical protein
MRGPSLDDGMTLRARILQGLLELYETPRYLEVGVSDGATFSAVRAYRKVAVDPRFGFDLPRARQVEPDSEFHEVSSDQYFGRIVEVDEHFDVIFLDGLHTFGQTLRDLNNALLCLAEGGVVVIDDVRPASSLAAVPDPTRFKELRRVLGVESGAWMGDVYRLVFFIESFYQQLTYRTVEEGYGQLILWRQAREEVQERTVEEIARMSFEDMTLSCEHLRFAPYEEILVEVRMHVGGASRRGHESMRSGQARSRNVG